jgi:predicted Zn finger-like uncharacterized protein
VRFDCEQCKSKYSIEDARVRGKVLKIRCKSCGNVITVRDPAAGKVATPAAVDGGAGNGRSVPPVTGAPAGQRAVDLPSEGGLDDVEDRTVFSAGPPPAASPEPEWYISSDGQQEGPFFAEHAAQRAREETARGKEVYAWREGFGDWLPIGQVPELARLLRASPPTPPAPRLHAPGVAPPQGSPAARGGEDSRLHPRSSVPVASAAPLQTGPSRAQEERKEPPAVAREAPIEPLPPRERYTGDEEGATPLPTPAFYSGEFPLDDLAEGGSSAAPAQGGGSMFPASDPGQELLISEPSVMVPLPVMAELQRLEQSGRVEVPPAAAPEPTPRRRGGVLIGGLIAAGALGLVAYLVLGRRAGDTVGEQRVSRKIDDTPVALVDNPILVGGAPRGQGGNGKGAGATGAATGGKAPHSSTANAARPGDAPGPKVQHIGSLTAPSLGEVAGEGRSLERIPTEPTESQNTKVNPEDMLRVVRQNKKSVELCYERGLKFDSNLKGKVEVELKIGISGRVTDIKLLDPAIAASQLGMCLSQSIKRWNFPSSGSEYSFAFPLILQAN